MRWALILGALLSGLAVVAALTGLVWTPGDIAQLDMAARMQPPSAAHWLGTDHLGRDMLSMVMKGAQVSLSVALVAVGIGMAAGVPLGLLAAARRGGIIDDLVMRANDLVFAFPAIIIAIMLTTIYGQGVSNAIIAIGIFNIPVFARVTRGAAMPVWTLDYIRAAQIAGKGALRISAEHILPNILNLLIVQATIQFSLGILAEAGLSYVGLGAAPPAVSWGRMLADAQTLFYGAPHIVLVPGLAIVATVLGLNLLGDGLRDLLDPRLRVLR